MTKPKSRAVSRNHSVPHQSVAPTPAKHGARRFFVRALVLVVIAGGLIYGLKYSGHTVNATKPPTTSPTTTKSVATTPVVKAPTPAAGPCTGNTLSQLAIVSITDRHMWACDGSSQVYDSAVVTGMENLPADLTPTGTYHIYAKETDLYLNGSDSTGSWHDYVYYWMPFLHNQYGSYGFHDATWRAADAFGNISPYSSDASHGCVELPLTTAKWLFNWAEVGTTVTINS